CTTRRSRADRYSNVWSPDLRATPGEGSCLRARGKRRWTRENARIDMLPPLIRKAAEDAGFDLTLGAAGEWTRLGSSGVEGWVWVVPVRAGALLALGPAAAALEFETVTWTDVPLPRGAARAARFRTPADLYDALRRVRVLLSQAPPLPEKRFEERLKAVSATEAE